VILLISCGYKRQDRLPYPFAAIGDDAMNSVRWGLLSTANINKRLILRSGPRRGQLAAVASRDMQKARA
jgi:hypothetical protein